MVELKEYASKAGITITDDDIFTDIISGFKDGELRPQYSLLKQKIEAGEYQQILFSEFSRLDRKPSNLLRSIEYYQKHDVHLYFKKQNLWVKDKSDIASQIMDIQNFWLDFSRIAYYHIHQLNPVVSTDR